MTKALHLISDQLANYNLFLPTEIRFGIGRLAEVFEIVGEKKTLLVIGGSSLRKTGVVKKFEEKLGDNLVLSEGTLTNPTLKEVNRVVQIARDDMSEIIVGIGGGSVLDTAKCAAALATNGGEINEYLNGEKKITKTIPYIAVPTTSGTGSEVTPWATVWDMAIKKKYSLSSPLMFPEYAIVDPQLTVSLPKDQTASTGLDALCQAMEAYWARATQSFSQSISLQAIKMVFANLSVAYNEPENLSYRCGMSQASLMAGIAFSQTRTTACHAVSYPLTARFGIPHGIACILTLPTFFEYNSSTLSEKALNDLLSSLEVKSVTEGKEKIIKLAEEIGINLKLSAWGIKKEDLPQIASESFTPGRADNNPRDFGQDLHKLLLSIL